MSSESAVNGTPDSGTHHSAVPDGAVPDDGARDSGVLYSERLWPTPWIWLIVLGISAAGILMFIPISPLVGYSAAALILIIQVVLLLLSTPRIEVTDDSLQVGRAHIERRYVGSVQVYRGDDATVQRGTELNGLAFLCIRGWINPVVKIEITDEADPTPYWLASSRHPGEFAAALGAARQRPGAGTDAP